MFTIHKTNVTILWKHKLPKTCPFCGANAILLTAFLDSWAVHSPRLTAFKAYMTASDTFVLIIATSEFAGSGVPVLCSRFDARFDSAFLESSDKVSRLKTVFIITNCAQQCRYNRQWFHWSTIVVKKKQKTYFTSLGRATLDLSKVAPIFAILLRIFKKWILIKNYTTAKLNQIVF